jgi:hypothetical protein
MIGEDLIIRQLSGCGFSKCFRVSAVDMEVTSSSRIRIERRVRHLGEQLLEVVKERRLAIGKHRERRVRAIDPGLFAFRPSAMRMRRSSGVTENRWRKSTVSDPARNRLSGYVR